MANESLRNKTLKGVGWSATENLLQYGTSFIIGLILARLLSPVEYGMIGMAMVCITIMNVFVDSGFSSALIRKVDATDEDYSTMFVTNMFVSIVMYLVLFASAPFISSFMKTDITAVVRVLGIAVLIKAFSFVQNTYLSKRIDFKTKAKATFTSAVTGGIAGVIGAFAGMGVWALVLQQLLTGLVNTILLWFMSPWKPSLKFNTESFRYLWGFGSKMLLSSLLDQIWKQIYVVLVGKVYSSATLGQYTRAKHYAELFSSNINSVVSKITYPTLSNIQNEEQRMISVYRRIIKVTMFVTTICLFGLGAVSEPLLYCLIGPQWSEAASYLPFICVQLSLYPMHSINLNMLMVQGRSDLFLYLEIIKKFLSPIPICLGIFVGIKAMLLGAIAVGIASYFLNSYYTGKKLNYSSWKQLKDVAPSYGIALLVALSVYFFKYLSISYFIILPIQIAVGVVVFFIANELVKTEEYLEVKSIAIRLICKIIGK